MLVLARQAKAIAEAIADPVAGSTADCWIGVSLFWLADYPQALSFAERASVDATPMLRHAQIGTLRHRPLDGRAVRDRPHSFWLQGLLDQSAQINRDILARPGAERTPRVDVFRTLPGAAAPVAVAGPAWKSPNN